MKALIIALTLIPTLSMAEVQTTACTAKPKATCEQKLFNRNKEIASLKEQIKKLEKELIIAQNKTPAEIITYVNRPVYVTRTVERTIDKTRTSAISLLLLSANTKFEASSTSSGYEASTKREQDLGIMFQHDFNRIRASAGVGTKGTGLLGLGFAF